MTVQVHGSQAHERTKLGSGLSSSAWPSLGCCRHLRSELIDADISLSLPPFIVFEVSFKITLKSKNKEQYSCASELLGGHVLQLACVARKSS